MHYWLVAKSDGTAQLVKASARPANYQYALDMGPVNQSQSSLQQQFANASSRLPPSINVNAVARSLGFNSISPSLGGPEQGALDTVLPGVGAATATGAGISTPGFFNTIGDAITSTLDFIKMIAWLFYPRNILRAVEFLVGIALMVFGLHAAMQSRGERLAGFTSGENALSRSALGRVADELGAAARRRGGSGSSQESPRQPRKIKQAPHKRRETERRERHRRGERALSVREQRERRLASQQEKRTRGRRAQY